MIIIGFVVLLAIVLVAFRRKLGYFGLAMLAGSMLDLYWNPVIVDFLTTSSLKIPASVLSGVVSLVLVLAPGFLIISKDQPRQKFFSGLLPSIFVSILGLVLCLVALGRIFVLDKMSFEISKYVATNSKFMILAGVIWSLGSILSINNKKSDKKP